MSNETKKSDATVQEAPQEQEGGWVRWLGLLAEAPGVGPWVSLALLVIPLAPFLIVGDQLGLMEGDGRATGGYFVILFLASLVWLRFLRSRTGISLSFYFIPCIWISWGGILVGAYGILFGFK